MIQYYHNQNEHDDFRFTMALEIPEKEVFEKMMELGTSKYIELQVGFSIVHPKDRYVKSIGREVSIKRLKSVIFRLDSCIYDNDSLELRLNASDKNQPPFRITIRLLPNCKKPHFIFAYTTNY